jgi:peroxiredoxin
MVRLVVAAVLLLTWGSSAHAALDIGERAPAFTASAAMGGKVYEYSLAASLQNGPVVLYFFPAAYSDGCSLEAHNFAEATADFAALGATVVGVSADDIATLSTFSKQACQSRFPVVSDQGQSIMRSYDAVMQTRPEYANRISYIIAPDGSIVFHYMNLNPNKHVDKMLDALRDWSAKAKH